MERRTLVLIVSSPLPRVGKTFVSRLLVQFFAANDRRVAAYDVNPDDNALAEQVPEFTTIANVGETKGQMDLFDRLIVAGDTVRVVDVGFRDYERFFEVMDEIDFPAEARRRGISAAVLFVADAGRRAAEAFMRLHDQLADLLLVPVVNVMTPDAPSRANLPLTSQVVPLRIPFLSPAMTALLAQGRHDGDFAGTRRRDTEIALEGWLRGVFLQFRELELRLLLENLKPALRLRA